MSPIFALEPAQLIYAAFAIVGSWSLGSFLKITGTAERIFVGLGTISGTLLPLLIISPGTIRWIAFGLISLGILRAFFLLVKKNRSYFAHFWNFITSENFNVPTFVTEGKHKRQLLWRTKVLPHLWIASLSAILTFWLFPTFYTFESHDLIYFGWLPSLFIGNDLVVNFAEPMLMGVANSIPSLFLVPLASPFTSPDFLDFIELRALIVFLFTFLIVKKVAHFTKAAASSQLLVTCALGFILIIWGGEWVYAFLISSYVPAIGLALITLSLLRGEKSPTIFFILFTLVAVAKAPIIGISLFTLLFMAFTKQWRPSPSVMAISGTLILVSITTWIFAEKGFSAANSAFSVLGLGLDPSGGQLSISWHPLEWALSFTGAAGWINDYPMSWVKANMFSVSRPILIAFTALSMIWLLMKYFVSYFLVRSQLSKKFSSRLNPLDIWAGGALISTFFIRNGESHSLGHQAHAFILLSVPVSILYAHHIISRRPKFLERMGGVGAVLVSVSLFISGLWAASNPVALRAESYSAISLKQAQKEFSELQLIGEFINSDPSDYSRRQVIAAITGSRLSYIQNPNPISQVDNFLVFPK